MATYAANPTAQYKQQSILTAPPGRLVVMLYDGALKFLGQARDAMADGDRVAKRHALSRGLAIVQELQHMLNMDAGGEVALRLDGLYTYILGRCYEANSRLDPAGLEEALKLLTPLRDAWASVAETPSSGA